MVVFPTDEVWFAMLRLLVLLGIFLVLWRDGRREAVHRVAGWRWLVGGFGLLLAGALAGMGQHLPVAIRLAGIGSFAEDACSVGGLSLVALGFRMWLPTVIGRKERQAHLEDLCDNLQQQLRRRSIELVHAREGADAAQEAKSEFLAHMSHQLRTPLSSIVGFTDAVMGMELGADQRDYLEIVRYSSRDLQAAVDNILDLADLRAGRILLDKENFLVRRLIDEVFSRQERKAREKGLRLEWRVDADVPKDLQGDSRQLSRIIAKLVDNGIKYSRAGWVSLHAAADVVDSHGVLLHFKVRDTGCGVPTDRREQIFEPFSPNHGSTAGAGLGLSIARQLARMMGGDLWLECDDAMGAVGSVFHFTVKLAWPKALERPALAADDFNSAGSRILLVEDDPVHRMLAERFLQWEEWRVTSVDNGRLALAALAEHPFDLILMDILLPEMDGLETVAAIRAAEEIRGGHVRIIALTAYATAADRQRCLAAGMDDYLCKPFRGTDLVALVEEHLRAAAQGRGAVPN